MAQITDADKRKLLTVYIPDTRGVTLSNYGRGNLKLGFSGVYTWSRLPGRTHALGTPAGSGWNGTCPGASDECLEFCYAARPVEEMGPVATMWLGNSMTSRVDPIPEDCRLLRIHVSGDFDSVDYIENWIARILERPDVHVWAYTKSWRVTELLPALERLRALPNIQLFASVDKSMAILPPIGWRRAWIDGDPRAGTPLNLIAHHNESVRLRTHNFGTLDGTMSYICPEETKRKANCEECRYCIDGRRNDVTFLMH